MGWRKRARRVPNAAASPPPAAGSVDRYFELCVLGLVTSGYLAVLGSGYLDAPTAIATAVGLAVRALVVIGIIRLPVSARATTAVTIAYIGFYPLDYLYFSRDFITATVHLVFFLAVVKVLTAHATRDYVFLGIVGFLELLAAAVLSSNLAFFVFLALFLVFAIGSFASAEIRRSIRRPRQVGRAGLRRFAWRLGVLTLAMSIAILVLAAGLFFLLPRTAQAAFRHLVPQSSHLPGFSNEMTLGEIGEIRQRRTAVMHVRIENARHPAGLKWRGTALSRFDGRRWFNPPEAGTLLNVRDGVLELADFPQRRRKGVRINYDVQSSAALSDVLFLAGRPEFIQVDVSSLIRTSDGAFRTGVSGSAGLRYTAYSFLEETAASPDPVEGPRGVARLDYLQLPRLDPRIVALAQDLGARAATDAGRARAIEQYLQRGFAYTTRLLDRDVPDPLANFLFERRAGHCEYFASAMAVLLRVLGIPTRVATGFRTGVLNPVSGWYVIRASDAHSWVEAWLPSQGWTPFDPTPPSTEATATSPWTRLGFCLDAADTFWQDWVLNYNLDQQLTLATRMENSSRRFGSEWLVRLRLTAARWTRPAVLEPLGAAVIALGAIALALWLLGPHLAAWWRTRTRVRLVQQGHASSSDATLLYGRMLRILTRRGLHKPAWVTPGEFARGLPASPAAELVREFTIAYNDLRFGGKAQAAPQMMALLERIEREPASP